ncbi:hypothetical protein, partial [Pokkaliibacter plantistimulans]|uniref:hypothetical protein n=1 Tax=Pokkaliibacter plantistimulans TaxID=1635171 RepID=UPI001A9C6EB7
MIALFAFWDLGKESVGLTAYNPGAKVVSSHLAPATTFRKGRLPKGDRPFRILGLGREQVGLTAYNPGAKVVSSHLAPQLHLGKGDYRKVIALFAFWVCSGQL